MATQNLTFSRLAELRGRFDLTQEQAAAIAGLSLRTWATAEAGQGVSYRTAAAILRTWPRECGALGITVDRLCAPILDREPARDDI